MIRKTELCQMSEEDQDGFPHILFGRTGPLLIGTATGVWLPTLGEEMSDIWQTPPSNPSLCMRARSVCTKNTWKGDISWVLWICLPQIWNLADLVLQPCIWVRHVSLGTELFQTFLLHFHLRGVCQRTTRHKRLNYHITYRLPHCSLRATWIDPNLNDRTLRLN